MVAFVGLQHSHRRNPRHAGARKPPRCPPPSPGPLPPRGAIFCQSVRWAPGARWSPTPCHRVCARGVWPGCLPCSVAALTIPPVLLRGSVRAGPHCAPGRPLLRGCGTLLPALLCLCSGVCKPASHARVWHPRVQLRRSCQVASSSAHQNSSPAAVGVSRRSVGSESACVRFLVEYN